MSDECFVLTLACTFDKLHVIADKIWCNTQSSQPCHLADVDITKQPRTRHAEHLNKRTTNRHCKLMQMKLKPRLGAFYTIRPRNESAQLISIPYTARSHAIYLSFIPYVLNIHVWHIHGGAKKVSRKFLSIFSPNIDRFSTFIHRLILWKICNKVVTKYTTTR